MYVGRATHTRGGCGFERHEVYHDHKNPSKCIGLEAATSISLKPYQKRLLENGSGAQCYNPSVSPILSAKEWDEFLQDQPEVHLLQTTAWGDLKSEFGWQVERVVEGQAGAQILFRPFLMGVTLAYLPKGPVGKDLPALLPALKECSQERGSFLLKIEPDEVMADWHPQAWVECGFRPSSHSIQPRRTLVIDLTAPEEELLAAMHQKTRYNIRLAGRKGVRVRAWSDLDHFGRMMSLTAERGEFGAHTTRYYQRAYELFHPTGHCELLVAEAEGEQLAALMVFASKTRAWYLYGASTSMMRDRMPTYLLQWEAMRWAKAKGCRLYDMWGIPDKDRDTLEEEFPERSDGLWGVYRFKRGFGGALVRSPGTWDLSLHKPLSALYRLYTSWKFN